MQTMQNSYKIFTLEKRHQRQEIQERLHLSSRKIAKRRYRHRKYCTRERERERERAIQKLIPELFGAPLNLLGPLNRPAV